VAFLPAQGKKDGVVFPPGMLHVPYMLLMIVNPASFPATTGNLNAHDTKQTKHKALTKNIATPNMPHVGNAHLMELPHYALS
jgi:hypothetical protein